VSCGRACVVSIGIPYFTIPPPFHPPTTTHLSSSKLLRVVLQYLVVSLEGVVESCGGGGNANCGDVLVQCLIHTA